MKDILKELGLSENEIKVYLALLKLKKGTKTPILREARVIPSKIYDILDRLVQRGLVSYYVENNIRQYIPTPPSSVHLLFQEKMQRIATLQKEFEEELEKYYAKEEEQQAHVQVFEGWEGVKQMFSIFLKDFEQGDVNYILGNTGGENIEQAMRTFPPIDCQFIERNVQRKALINTHQKEEARRYFSEVPDIAKNWEVRYIESVNPFEISIGNSCVALNLLEEHPIVIFISNKRIRDAYLHYFNMLWGYAEQTS